MKDTGKEFREQIMGAVQNRGKGDVADAIGMPDEKDYEILLKIISKYEQKNPGEIVAVVSQARAEFKAGVYGKRLEWDGGAIVGKNLNIHYRMELPVGLGNAIEKIFPSMFRSKKHLRWLCEKFPQLTIAGKV